MRNTEPGIVSKEVVVSREDLEKIKESWWFGVGGSESGLEDRGKV